MKKIISMIFVIFFVTFSFASENILDQNKELKAIVEQYIANHKALKTSPQKDIEHEQLMLKAKFVNNIHDLKPSNDKFYNTLYKIQKAYLNGDNENSLKNIIDDYLVILPDLKLEENHQQSYKELLSYLRANLNVFSNDKINQIGTTLTKYIDSILPDYLKNKGIGSLFVCVVFLLVVYFIRHFLINLLKNFIARFYKDKDRLEHIFKELHKPLLIFISVYSIYICVRFYYYPNPISLIVAKTFGVIFSVSVAYLAMGLLNGWGVMIIEKVIKKQNSKDVVNLLLKVLYCLIVLIAILTSLSVVGFDISAIIASLGIGGLALALAAKDIIANFFASILLAFDDSFSQGDWVIINGVEGIVVETGLRKTSIRTFDNTLVFLPNANVLGGNIQNFSKRKFGRKMVITVGLTYDATREQINKFLKEVTHLLHTDKLVAHSDDDEFNITNKQFYNRQKFVSRNDLEGYRASIYTWIDDFAASSINVKLYFYTKTISAVDYYKAKSELMLKIMELVEKNNLSFAFPSQSLYIESLPKSINNFLDKNKE